MVSLAVVDLSFFCAGGDLTQWIAGRPCDSEGQFLPAGAPPPPWDVPQPDDWSPYESRSSFELADLLFRRDQMSGSCISDLMQIWASTLLNQPENYPPFANKDDMYDAIDATQIGDIPWQSFLVTYNGPLGDGNIVPWKVASYDVWFRDPLAVLKSQLSNPDFAKEMDFAPKEVHDTMTGCRRYQDFMSGQWAWRQAVHALITFYVSCSFHLIL
jgi:hypothetical protein